MGRDMMRLRRGILLNTPHIETASGAVASFKTDIRKLKGLSVSIEPVQSGSGNPSPTNIRPISGWSEAKIWVQPTHDTTEIPTVTIDLDGTRYGGTLDVLTGVLTVDRASTTINNELWNYSSSSGHFASSSSSPLQSKRKPGRTNLKSSAYLTSNAASSASAPDYSIRGNSNSAQIYIKDTRYTSVSTWKAAMGDTQIVYELAEPLIVQLTPEQISALKGTNNIWADTGNTEVKYWTH